MKRTAISFLLALAVIFSFVLVTAPEAQAASAHPHDNAEAGYTHCTCGGDAVGVGDHKCLSADKQNAITWIDLNSEAVVKDQNNTNYGKAYQYILGNENATDYYYYLSGNLEVASRFTFASNKNITICMNGYKIFSEKTDVNGRIFNMTGAGAGTTVNLCDCGTGGSVETKAVCSGQIAFLQDAKHTFNLFDVALKGSNEKVAPDSYGNTGVVTLAYNTQNTFNMYGGTITGGKTTGAGGNIYISYGTMNMYGGVITDGEATALGGNIMVKEDGVLEVRGGTISGGKAAGNGGNVAVEGKMTVYDGTITRGEVAADGDATALGGNIMVKEGATLEVRGGTISGGKADGRGGNVAVEGTMNVYNGEITGGITSEKVGGNITVQSTGVLDVKGGTITKGEATVSHGGNIAVYGTLTVSGGTISDGKAYVKGGNIFINGSAATITGGTISGGTDSMGAGIWINGSKTLTVGENANIQCAVFENSMLTLNADLNATLDPGFAVRVAAESDKASQYKTNARIVIDLNGFNLSGRIKNTADKDTTHTYTVYIKDSAAADFDISDGKYGIFSATLDGVTWANGVSGNGFGGQAGAGVASGERYVAVAEAAGGYSFHRIYIAIEKVHMQLDSDSANIGYVATFKTDAVIKSKMNAEDIFGIKVYLIERDARPNSKPIQDGQDTTISLLLNDVIKIGGDVNAARAMAPIKARTYVTIGGQLIEGSEYAITLREIVEAADAKWDDPNMEPKSKELLKQMYDSYSADMKSWNIPNIKGALNVTLPTVSEAEENNLRDKALKYMENLCTIKWTPSKTVTLDCGCGNEKHKQTFKVGNTYTGMPYSHAATSYEKFMSHVNGNTLDLGVVDIKDLGNDCADTIYWAWSQISSGITFTQTNNAMCYNGTLPVGNYTVNGQETTSTYDTASVCSANGAQAMYEAYAQIKKGDAILTATPGGHMRMAYKEAEVSYSAGKIDPSRSYIYTYEQGGVADGQAGCSMGKYTFAKLFADNYIPLTIAAFTQGMDTEQVFVCNATDATLAQMAAEGYVTSNFRINSITLKVKTASGTAVNESTVYPFYGSTTNGNTVELSVFQSFVDGLSLTSGAQYTYEIIVHAGDADISAQTVSFTA